MAPFFSREMSGKSRAKLKFTSKATQFAVELRFSAQFAARNSQTAAEKRAKSQSNCKSEAIDKLATLRRFRILICVSAAFASRCCNCALFAAATQRRSRALISRRFVLSLQMKAKTTKAKAKQSKNKKLFCFCFAAQFATFYLCFAVRVSPKLAQRQIGLALRARLQFEPRLIGARTANCFQLFRVYILRVAFINLLLATSCAEASADPSKGRTRVAEQFASPCRASHATQRKQQTTIATLRSAVARAESRFALAAAQR